MGDPCVTSLYSVGTFVCACLPVCVHFVCVCVFVCVCEREREREREREGGGESEKLYLLFSLCI